MCVQFDVFAMWIRLFLVLVLVLSVSGLEDRSGSERVTVFAGEAAVLPCRTDIPHEKLTVEWFKQDLHPDIVLVSRRGSEIHAEKNLAYEFRSSLFMNELKTGNISLRISSVQLSDGGRYTCRTIMDGKQRDRIIELIVVSVSVSEPRLWAFHTEGDGLTLQCEAGCWFPKPEMTFLDDGGHTLSGDLLNAEDNSRKCFNITMRVRVKASVRRVTCRIQLPGRNELRVTGLYLIDGGVTSCTALTSYSLTTSTSIATVEGLILLGLIPVLVWFLVKSSCSKPRLQEIPADLEDDIRLGAERQRKIEDLKQKLLTKEKENKELCQQLNELKSMLNPHSPEPVGSPQSRDGAPRSKPQTRRPDLFEDISAGMFIPPPLIPLPLIPPPVIPPLIPLASVPLASVPPASVYRSKSLSVSQPSQKARPKRRYTTGMSVLSEEDGEQLLHPDQPDPAL